MLQNGLTRERLSNTAIVSSSASTDNDICAISSTTENDGMPSSYCLDNNFSSVFANRKMVCIHIGYETSMSMNQSIHRILYIFLPSICYKNDEYSFILGFRSSIEVALQVILKLK